MTDPNNGQCTECGAYTNAATSVGGWISRQPEVSEESLTDWLLDNIWQNSSRTMYQKFNKREEARRTGADWEWWLVYRSGTVRLRVQAKYAKNGRIMLNHTNKYGRQLDHLICDAKSVNAFPIYAIYSDECNRACGLCSTTTALHTGVFFVEATQLLAILNSRQRPKTFVRMSELTRDIPLKCFMCCLRETNPGKVREAGYPYDHDCLPVETRDGVRGFFPETSFRHIFRTSDEALVQLEESETLGWYSSTPPHIAEALNTAGTGGADEMPTLLITDERFAAETSQVGAIMITDMRFDSSEATS